MSASVFRMPGRSLTRVVIFKALMAAFLAASVLSLPSSLANGHRSPAERFPGASTPPSSQSGWQKHQTKPNPDATPAESSTGLTWRGTEIKKRHYSEFPAESREFFYEVDQVYNEASGKLEPIDYGGPHKDYAIRGRNTWMMWAGGNEIFWGWLQERGYGLNDFLVLLDSRKRDSRFERAGLINQPGMRKNETAILGLYLDAAVDKNAVKLKARPEKPAAGGTTYPTAQSYDNYDGYYPDKERTALGFTPADDSGYQAIVDKLPKDGANPYVYGYPSGVIGLRLWPNADFFGQGEGPAKARAYWKERVENNGNAYYDLNSKVQADPKLVRPFNVSLACVFCHVAPHPLNPPANVNAPEWKNLSSTIGNQFWVPQPNFGSLLQPKDFIWQFVNSQQPGTIDASLVSPDHLNNPNTIISLYALNPRIERALLNPPEVQGPANRLMPAIEPKEAGPDKRYVGRILIDGSDSIGVHGALARVFPNIGTYSEEWLSDFNPILGFMPHRPFSLATAEKNSVYWQANQKERVPYLATYFTYQSSTPGQPNVTAPMHPQHAVGIKPETLAKLNSAENKANVAAGRGVFVRNCAMCHSSKQPEDYRLSFSSDWAQAAAPKPGQPPHFTLPNDYAEWEAFKKSAAYAEYVRRIVEFAGNAGEKSDPFIDNNYLSTDIRIPVTLVGTNSARAVGTNAMAGQVWDNFSSEDYKKLPAVGAVRFYNPYSKTQPDALGNNDAYAPPPGGPGYYRPASLVSIWATGPYLHNNTLGIYSRDPSVEARLAAFDDGIDRLLWQNKRATPYQGNVRSDAERGDLRHVDGGVLAAGDTGWIYRNTEMTHLWFSRNFIPSLVDSFIGPVMANIIWIAIVLLGVGLLILVIWRNPRHAGMTLFVKAVLYASIIAVTRLDKLWPWLWFIPLGLGVFAIWVWVGRKRDVIAGVVLFISGVLTILVGAALGGIIHGKLLDVNLGPFPKGMPVNLVMNMSPAAPLGVQVDAATALVRGMLLAKRELPSADDFKEAEKDPKEKQDLLTKQAKALAAFENEAGAALLKASKCPDFVMDRGHWFGEALTDEEKKQLKAFLRTL